MGLALLPIDRIQEEYKILKQRVTTSSQAKQLDAFVSYFEHEWMHVFKPSVWSVNKNTWRTNNHAVGKTVFSDSFNISLRINLYYSILIFQHKINVYLHVLFSRIHIYGD